MPRADSSECPFLFVYGTLKRAKGHPQHEHLKRYARYVCEGMTRGLLFRIDWYPALVHCDEANAWVSGEIYHMHEPVALLEKLDAFECYNPHHPDSSEYHRVLRMVKRSDGNWTPCQLYVYQRPVNPDQRIASGTF